MAVHVPRSSYAQAEARIQMLSANNILSSASGEPVDKPSRDIILGIYYITQIRHGKPGIRSDFDSEAEVLEALAKGELELNSPLRLRGQETTPGRIKHVFANLDEALLAVAQGLIDLQDQITLRLEGKLIATSTGRAVFARLITETIGEDGTPVPEELVSFDLIQEKNSLRDLVYRAYLLLGAEKTAKLLDAVKDHGFHYSTTSGITIGIDDAVIPPQKREILAGADRDLEKLERAYSQGYLTAAERFKQIVDLWGHATDQVTAAVFENFKENYPFNALYVMSQSGARGNPQQIRQLCGMRGLMA
jgi:DNA-directed RNA polymerase subunit beta'